jgi:hypothetical protein
MNGAKMSENTETQEIVQEAEKISEEIAQNNANLSPEEIAATFFKNYYPTYKLLIGKLNKKDAVRLADALIGWPLEVDEPKFFNNDAKKAFWIGNQLLDCKLIMRSAVELDAMSKAVQTNNDAVTEGENSNG